MADPFSLSVQYQNDVGRTLDESGRVAARVDRGFTEGLKIPQIAFETRVARNQAIESDRQLSVNEQLESALKDPHGFANQFAELKTAEEMRKFMARHAAIVVTPFGERVMQRFDHIATATEQAEIHSIDKQLELATAKKQAEFMAGAIDAGVDVRDGVALNAYKIRENKARGLADFEKRANAAGLNPYSVQFGQDAYDELGNLDPDAARIMLGQATPAQRLVTQQEIADNRTAAQQAIAAARLTAQREGRSFAPSQLERVILESEKRGIHFTQDEIDDMVRIRTGIKPRAVKVQTPGQFADAHLNSTRRQDESDGITRSDKARAAYLKSLHTEFYGETSDIKVKAPTPEVKDGKVKVLKDGKLGWIPESDLDRALESGEFTLPE